MFVPLDLKFLSFKENGKSRYGSKGKALKYKVQIKITTQPQRNMTNSWYGMALCDMLRDTHDSYYIKFNDMTWRNRLWHLTQKWHKTGCHLKWGDMTLSSVIWLYMRLQETNKNDPKECDLNDMIWNLKWHEVRQSMMLHVLTSNLKWHKTQCDSKWGDMV